MWTSRPTGVCRINRWTKHSAEHAERIEKYYCESLALSRHNVDLEFDEKVMKAEKLTEVLVDAGFNPITLKVKKVLKGDSQR